MRLRPPLAAAAIAVLVACAALVLVLDGDSDSSPPAARPPGPGGYLPVPVESIGASKPPSLFLAPDGSDEAKCTRKSPCASLARAYLVARPGQVVELAAGRYDAQILPLDPSKDSDADVVFAPARGADVTVGPVTFGGPQISDLGAAHVTVRDMTVEGFSTQRSSDLTFSGVTVDGNFAIQGGGDIRVLGGSVGGTSDASHSEIAAYSGPRTVDPPRDVTIDGVVFHDVRMSTPEDHIECLQSTDAVGLTVRNARFVRCDTFDLRIDRYRTEGPRDVVIENNVFQHTRDRFGGTVYYGLAVRAGTGVVIRNNSSDIAWAGPEPDTPASDWLVTGNAMPGGRCDDRFSYRYNLWDGGAPCHPTDRVGGARFSDPGQGDFRLLPGSPALNLSVPRAATAVDHQRTRRDGRPDAGAFEGVSQSG